MYLIFKQVVLVGLLLAIARGSVGDKDTRHFCDVSAAKIVLTGTTLPAPSFVPMFIGLGVGTQIYSCGSTGTYKNVGAFAEIFDASCLYGTSGFTNLSSNAFAAWNVPANVTRNIFDTHVVISATHVIKFPFTLGQHYFTTDPVAGLSPKWDFTSGMFPGQPAAFVVGFKVVDDSAPTNSAVNIDWLYLTNLTGTLADEIYRIDTQGGQPPTLCTFGESPEIFVKYTAMYWLTGGSF